MALKLYNTLTRKKEVFKPIKAGVVKMYNCGPTVYNYAHIGNFRAFMCSDILKRYFLYKGLKVKQVMNLTDVDDKTIKGSQEEKISLKEFTEKYTKAFFEDMQTLNILPAEVNPKATEHIKEMVQIVKTLMEKGHAYKAKDAIYFKISSFPKYGQLAKIKLEKQKAGLCRIKADEYDKEDVHDFALWKFWDENDGDVFWETEIGKGRPGWHIECSAMSTKYLGEHFDIHTGGIDLIFPHHENEIAQAQGCGMKFANFWLHNDYILVDGKKMSKRYDNFYTLRNLLGKGYNPKAMRYLLLSANYRQQLNFTLKGIDSAKQAFDRILEFVDNVKEAKGEENPEIKKLIEKTKKEFEKAMDDDLNISTALASVFEFIKEINKLVMENKVGKKNSKDILAFMKKIDMVLGLLEDRKEEIPKEVIELAEKRVEARKNKDWKTADELRDNIKELGYSIDDKQDGYKIRKI